MNIAESENEATEPEAVPVAPEDTPDQWLQTARDASQAGQPDRAKSHLEQAAARFPDDARFPQELARLAAAQQRWPDAERHWRDFAALAPDTWWGPARVAAALAQQGRLDEADSLLTELCDRFPQHAAVLADHARMAEQRGDWSAAAARWAVVTERFPERAEGMVGRARVLRAQGQADEADAQLLELTQRFPTETAPLHELARSHEAKQDWPAAEQCWRRFIELNPSPWWAHASLAHSLTRQGRVTEADAMLVAELEQRPRDPGLLIARARLADQQGDLPEMAQRWSLVAMHAPDRPVGFIGQVRALCRLQRFDEAKAVLDDGIERFPDHPALIHERGYAAERANDWAGAEQAWQALVIHNVDFWPFHRHLLAAQYRQGRKDDAMATLAAARQRFPANTGLLIDTVGILVHGGDHDQALGLIGELLDGTEPLTVRQRLQMARFALRCGDLDRAVAIVHGLHDEPLGDPQYEQDLTAFSEILKQRMTEAARASAEEPDAFAFTQAEHGSAEEPPEESPAEEQEEPVAEATPERVPYPAGAARESEPTSWLHRVISGLVRGLAGLFGGKSGH